MPTNENSRRRHPRWIHVLVAIITTVLILVGWLGYQSWRTSFPVRHARNEPLTAQMHVAMDDEQHFYKSIESSRNRNISFGRPDSKSFSVSSVAIRTDSHTVSFRYGSENKEESTILVVLYPKDARVGLDECLSSFSLTDSGAETFSNCGTGKDTSPDLTHRQQEQFARKAAWLVVDTAAAHW